MPKKWQLLLSKILEKIWKDNLTRIDSLKAYRINRREHIDIIYSMSYNYYIMKSVVLKRVDNFFIISKWITIFIINKK